jgi:ABC-type transport system involved in cytochrome c biogenesis permease subunit
MKSKMVIPMTKKLDNKYKSISFALMVLIIAAAVFPLAADQTPITESIQLRQIIILENGRKKPLDTYAQNILKQFSGKSKYGKQPAIQWLARALFDPEASQEDKVFLITNPEVLDSMGVSQFGKARDRYSFKHLEPGLTKLRELAIKVNKINAKNRSFIEAEIFALYNKLYIYQQLSASFQFLFKHEDFTINDPEVVKALDLPEGQTQFSLFDVFQKKDKLLTIITAAEKKKPEEVSALEKAVIEYSRRMMGWTQYYRDLPLTIIPGKYVEKGDEKEKWHSPWELLTPGKDGAVPAALVLMKDVVNAYRVNNAETFNAALLKFNQYIVNQAQGHVRPAAIGWEVFYNRLDPFYKAKFFFGFAVIFLLLSYTGLKKWFYVSSYVLLSAGFLLMLGGVVARMIIMNRPPVTNLYETFIFTGLITALLGIILELFKKKNIGILTGGLTGLVMLMIAGKYALEGDTMGMLVAVSDSNFWLATHVITIILGYAGVVLSGFLGHVYLLQRLFKPGNKELFQNTFQSLYAIQAFGIIFTFLGTVLGGIWADQSWGRFWGWDPKENGALLILLWSALLFHARLAKWVKEIGFALGTVIGNICVALAWFGVNLLGVGLHSYGFTSGVANTLFIFCVSELLFVLIVGAFLKLGIKEPSS